MQLSPAEQVPHRLLFAKATYTLDPAAQPESDVLVKVGEEAEGRPVFADLARANSRKFVFLATEAGFHVGYARPDLPSAITLAGLLREAFPGGPSSPEQALALRAVLALRHVVLLDGRRLGVSLGQGRQLIDSLTHPANRPEPSVARLSLQALVRLSEPAWEQTASQLGNHAQVRSLQDPDFGFVLQADGESAKLNKTTRDPVDQGQELLVQPEGGYGLSSDEFESPRRLTVTQVTREAFTGLPLDEGPRMAAGDPVRFAASGG